MESLCYRSACELASLVRRGDLSPVTLMEATLRRIERINPALNAFVSLRGEEALEEAKSQAERLARGEDLGPLGGLPLGVKDLEDVAGLPTTYGSVPFKHNRPPADSVQVKRLKRAGAIVVGKTNTPEFGYTAFTKNLIFGESRNPWNLERTPGGSSGGSAAAVASGLVPLATGSDGGGSIRIPASYVGSFGLKPSFGRIPRGPFKMLEWVDTVSYGPLCRSVEDAALYLDAVVGPDAEDPDSLPHPGIEYLEVVRRTPAGLKLAFNPTLGYAVVQRDVMREVERALSAFEELGYVVERNEERLPNLGTEWAILAGFQTYCEIEEIIERHEGEWGRAFINGIRQAHKLAPAAWGQAQRRRAELNRALKSLFDRYDLLLTPTMPTEAFAARGPLPVEVDGHPIEQPMGLVAFTFPFNLSGHPAATVRAGFSDSGLPVGLQIVGPRHRDDLVLQVAWAFEQVRPWSHHWPPAPDGRRDTKGA